MNGSFNLATGRLLRVRAKSQVEEILTLNFNEGMRQGQESAQASRNVFSSLPDISSLGKAISYCNKTRTSIFHSPLNVAKEEVKVSSQRQYLQDIWNSFKVDIPVLHTCFKLQSQRYGTHLS